MAYFPVASDIISEPAVGFEDLFDSEFLPRGGDVYPDISLEAFKDLIPLVFCDNFPYRFSSPDETHSFSSYDTDVNPASFSGLDDEVSMQAVAPKDTIFAPVADNPFMDLDFESTLVDHTLPDHTLFTLFPDTPKIASSSLTAFTPAASAPSDATPSTVPISQRRKPRGRRAPTSATLAECSGGKVRKHMCLHEGCGRLFVRNEHLVRHVKTHEPTSAYPCEFAGCTKSFTRKDNMRCHMMKHRQRASAF
ncbi:hypothetical protein BU17DRAFT_60297 [Hysterangium stoloniferum]|nr:hypothetical protein BU17DRAFT_60297 [Hysterangium stoloniferum]